MRAVKSESAATSVLFMDVMVPLLSLPLLPVFLMSLQLLLLVGMSGKVVGGVGSRFTSTAGDDVDSDLMASANAIDCEEADATASGFPSSLSFIPSFEPFDSISTGTGAAPKAPSKDDDKDEVLNTAPFALALARGGTTISGTTALNSCIAFEQCLGLTNGSASCTPSASADVVLPRLTVPNVPKAEHTSANVRPKPACLADR
mmetsp:Transcript_7319/g.15920  ORF Transcript_7319/g.15920 Transcript_7319/m.15920 type:complete len:203 (+) Transcript_7319:1343-1951(+)